MMDETSIKPNNIQRDRMSHKQSLKGALMKLIAACSVVEEIFKFNTGVIHKIFVKGIQGVERYLTPAKKEKERT